MGRIIAVHSFRGGTGKSNFTANLAVALAALGQRVGVVDTDIQSPGIHVLFGLDVTKLPRALNDYLWGRADIQDCALEVGAGLRRADGSPALAGGTVHLIPSSHKAGEIARILKEGYDVGVLNDGFKELLKGLALDYLLIDTHPGLNEETLLSVAVADLLILLMRPDRQDFQGTAVSVEVARKLEAPHIWLVVNKVLPGYDPAAVQAQVEAAFGAPVVGLLPLSLEVARLASAGIFILTEPDHPVSQTIGRIAGRIAAQG